MVHYIAGYADTSNVFNLKCSLAGVSKMNYIIHCLRELTPCVVYSTSQRQAKLNYEVPEWVRYRYSLISHGRCGYYLDLFFAIIQLLFYLLRIPSHDIVLVYHERWYTPWINIVHRIKKWKLVYEVEEIYCAVAQRKRKEVLHEIAQLKKADAYILSTQKLVSILNINDVPHAIVNGVYMPVYTMGKVSDTNTHLVYAGSLNKLKGADFAIKAMKQLPSDFILHVCGAGSAEDIAYTQALIDKYSNDNIVFEGCLSQDEHLALLRKCEVGLCPANPTAAFPSKILEYMRNGLKVVSIRKPEIESAECSDFLHFFNEGDMNGFISAILSANAEQTRNQQLFMQRMHNNFVENFRELLSK